MALQSGNWNPSLDFAELALEQEDIQTIADERLLSSRVQALLCPNEQERLGLGYIVDVARQYTGRLEKTENCMSGDLR